ncbi:MAG: tetratricopeptide repeat protein [Bacteroidetes bacterium]|nr:tetratricopeptide repeat protein [Bacteroidota bacterium]
MKKISLPLILSLSFFLISIEACGPSLSEITVSMLDQGRNDEAIARMRRALVNDPGNNEYMKLLGMALYNKKEYDEAIVTFKKVFDSDPEDDQAAYFLGLLYETTANYDKAILYYRMYNELSTLGEYKELVDARIKILYGRQMQAEAAKALQIESQLDVAKVPSNTVAILYFENKGNNKDLDPLEKGLAEMIITDLSKVKALRIVERVRLQKLIEEMNLSQSDLVDQKTAPRLGKLLGAYRLVKGSYFDMAKDKVRIDALVAQTKTGSLDATANISGSTKDFFRLEKELVFNILKELNIAISDDEREAILEIPTENFFAFLQYSKGIDFEDKGMYQQAFTSYSQAAAADPNFSQAKTSAVAAQKSEQIIQSGSSETSGSSTSGENTSSQQNTDQQTGTKKKAPAKTSGLLSSPVPPPPTSSGFGVGSSGVTDRLGNMNNVINQTVNPGTNTQNQPPRTVIMPLPEPPKPPTN